MAEKDVKQNTALVLQEIVVHTGRLTEISNSLGYTSTSQLHSVLNGDSLISTKALINLIEKHKVNPAYLFLE